MFYSREQTKSKQIVIFQDKSSRQVIQKARGGAESNASIKGRCSTILGLELPGFRPGAAR
jgi:hypothetical protein